MDCAKIQSNVVSQCGFLTVSNSASKFVIERQASEFEYLWVQILKKVVI